MSKPNNHRPARQSTPARRRIDPFEKLLAISPALGPMEVELTRALSEGEGFAANLRLMAIMCYEKARWYQKHDFPFDGDLPPGEVVAIQEFLREHLARLGGPDLRYFLVKEYRSWGVYVREPGESFEPRGMGGQRSSARNPLMAAYVACLEISARQLEEQADRVLYEIRRRETGGPAPLQRITAEPLKHRAKRTRTIRRRRAETGPRKHPARPTTEPAPPGGVAVTQAPGSGVAEDEPYEM